MSLSFSDHAAIEMSFNKPDAIQETRSRIVRLDPSLIKDNHIKEKMFSEVSELISQIPPDWNPHQRLEFCKMSIRTVAQKLQFRGRALRKMRKR